jgi:hypothetical protein
VFKVLSLRPGTYILVFSLCFSIPCPWQIHYCDCEEYRAPIKVHCLVVCLDCDTVDSQIDTNISEKLALSIYLQPSKTYCLHH